MSGFANWVTYNQGQAHPHDVVGICLVILLGKVLETALLDYIV